MSRARGRRLGSTLFLTALVAGCFAPCTLYGASYAWARGTHRLVHYGGGFIARENMLSGIGFTWEEVVFMPAASLEETVRERIDPSW